MYLRKSQRNLGLLKNSQTQTETWENYNPPEKSSPVQYCLDSSLHGIQYIGQQNRHRVERVFWIIAFIASVVCSGLLIHKLWEAYTDSPMMTVFDPEEIPVWKVAFPSVTICNVNKIKYSKFEEYKRNLKNSKTSSNRTAFLKSISAIQDLKNICDLETFTKRLVRNTKTPWSTMYNNFTEDFESAKDDNDKFTNPAKLLFDGSQDCQEMLAFCMWQDQILNCSELFRPIITDYGYCCTFNVIPPSLLMRHYNDSIDNPDDVKRWTEADVTSEKYIFNEKAEYYEVPYFQKYPSRSLGLSIILEPNLTEYYCTSTDSEGFMIGLRSPLDFPRTKDDAMLVQPGVETFVKIHPQIIISDKSIKDFPQDQRKCYFDGEGEQKLQHYRKYTMSNCLSECISELAVKGCGCVRYYMPRRPGIQLCKREKYDCVHDMERNITLSGKGCEYCYHTCTDIRYQAEVTSLRIRQTRMGKLFRAYPHLTNTSDLAIVHFYFGQDTYPTRRRKPVYTIIDLISSAGGLLGLCMGFSMLSLLEIVYYCTIRLCFIYRRKYIEKAVTMDELGKTPYYREISGETVQTRISEQVSQATAAKNCEDRAVIMVQSRSAWHRGHNSKHF